MRAAFVVMCAAGLALAAEQEPGTETLKSGVIVTTVKEGTGPTPGPKDEVTVHFRGALPDGAELIASNRDEKPVTFKLDAMSPCWAEGLQRVKSGGTAKLVCPPATAKGAPLKGRKPPKNATLVYEVELLEVSAPK